MNTRPFIYGAMIFCCLLAANGQAKEKDRIQTRKTASDIGVQHVDAETFNKLRRQRIVERVLKSGFIEVVDFVRKVEDQSKDETEKTATYTRLMDGAPSNYQRSGNGCVEYSQVGGFDALVNVLMKIEEETKSK